jgi:hypothetical protein
MFVLAIAFAAVPFGFGLLRFVTRADTTGVWMALAAGLGALLVRAVAASRGIRSSTLAVLISTLVIATVAAGAAAFAVGTTSGPGMWMVAFVIGLCWTMSLLFDALSRPASSR